MPSLNSRLRREGIGRINNRSASAPATAADRTVVLLQDAFTSLFEPELVIDTCRLIRHLGYNVSVHTFFENGKALHIKGYLDRLRRVVRKNLDHLLPLQEAGFTFVAIEPSVALTYRDEYVHFGPDEARQLKVRTVQEWLDLVLGGIDPVRSPAPPPRATLLPHCMESAGDPHLTASWPAIFARFGIDLKVESVGCCGMAGIYGHEVEHAATSKAIYEGQWRDKVEQHRENGAVLATGFSCRHQADRCASAHLEHPVCFLRRILIP